MNRPQLTLYGRLYCHLCEEMLAALHQLRGEHDFSVEVVDVDLSAELQACYGSLVPVLALKCGEGEEEICHYFLDAAKVREVLGRFR